MRLWFVTSRWNQDIFTKDEVYYKRSTSNNVLPKEKEYCKDIYVDGSWVNIAPMMCFAKVSIIEPCLTLFSLINHSDVYTSHLHGVLDGDIILEIEVQEKSILRMSDLIPPIAGESNIEYGSNVVLSNFKYALRNDMNGRRVVALVDRIRKIDIVTQYTFKRVSHDKICIINEIQRKDAFPITDVDVLYISSRGGLYPGRNSERVLDDDAETDYISVHAMSGAPRYFTLEEARYACNMDTILKIGSESRKRGIDPDDYKNHLVMDIFPDGLRLE